MTLRPEIVRERLRKLREAVRNLQELRDVEKANFRSSYRQYWVAERGLQIAAEAVFDVGTHVLSGAFNEHPSSYEDVTRLLGDCGVLDHDLRERLTGLGGFRNILVHGYLEVDRDEVYRMLQHRLSDFGDFADQIESFLDDRD